VTDKDNKCDSWPDQFIGASGGHGTHGSCDSISNLELQLQITLEKNDFRQKFCHPTSVWSLCLFE